jgi:hypothetical protein
VRDGHEHAVTRITEQTVAWAPAAACTLPTAERPLREAEFDQLFAAALCGVERPARTWLRLFLATAAGDEVEATTQDLIARESSCCSFFDFRLTPGGHRLVLDVRVPAERVEVLDGLARRAEAARAAGTGPGATA